MPPARSSTLRKGYFATPTPTPTPTPDAAVPVVEVVAIGALVADSVVNALVFWGMAGLVPLGAVFVGAAVIRIARHSHRPAAAADRSGSGLLYAGAAFLPDGVSARYAEEWCGELYDLRSDGVRRWTLAAYKLGILLRAVPVLAITLRLSRTRAVD